LLVAGCATLTVFSSLAALKYLSPSLFRASRAVEPNHQSSEASRERALAVQEEGLRQLESRRFYRYSVVPGGVRDARELKWAAEHDPVVRDHYRGFDYNNARVVRLVLERTAYISYRIGNKVYWTRRRIKLKKGETLITDGKITARTRCGNRVEEMPQQLTSVLEPPAVQFDEPAMPALGTASSTPPVPFVSSLSQSPTGLGPAPPLTVVDTFPGGTWVPILPPPLPGVCGVGPPKKHPIGEITASVKKKKKGDPCGNGGGGGVVPEPGTWLLMVSGLAIIYWRTRHRFART
jgi:hypothetical protein